MSKLIIYHAHCSDGIAAAWCFYKKFPDAEFYPSIHNITPIPNVRDKEVFILDYCYSVDVLLEIKKIAKSLLVLDHHRSSMTLCGFIELENGKTKQKQLLDKRNQLVDVCVFDMNKSGAGMAWDYLYPNTKRHWIIDYTEEKDLWRFNLPYSKEINAVLQSYPLSFDTFNLLENTTPDTLFNEGKVLLRQQNTMVKSILNKAQEIEIQGYKVLIVNTPVLQSEVAGTLALNRPFGITWFETENGDRLFSLRSTKESNINVSTIANKYGGGGHKQSAGFRLKKDEKL